MEKKPVIYQLFPRWYTNMNEHCVPGGSLTQNGVGKLNDITARELKSLKALSVTHVWYTGIIEQATQSDFSAYGIAPSNRHVVKGVAGSPYAIRDYYDVSPELAVDVPRRMQEFEALVERTHHAGLRVIIDFVPNHVARQYCSDSKPYNVHDLGEDDDETKFFDANNNFYYLAGQPFRPDFDMGQGDDTYYEYPARATGNDCFNAAPSRNDWYETVKLNYGVDPWNGQRHFSPTPDTWHKMLDIVLFWASKGVDGFRCDMAHMVPVEFWQWAIGKVKEQYPHIIFIAEIYDTKLYHDYIDRGGFDYLYDKVTLYDTLINVLNHNTSTQAISACWQTVNDIQDHMLNFLENHDEVRLASAQCCGDAMKARPALVVSALLTRCPFMLYAGQELGEPAADAEGYSGLDGRTTIFDYWSVPTLRKWLSRKTLNGRHKLRDYYKRVLAIAQSTAVSQGMLHDLMYANPQCDRQYMFLRHIAGETLLVAANFAAEPVTVGVRIPHHAFDHLGLPSGDTSWQELLHGGNMQCHLEPDGTVSLDIDAHDAVVWKLS